MKNAGFIALIVAAAGTIGAGAALARGGHGFKGPQMTFEQLDADGSGEVTQAEMEAAKAARFASADADGDGVLSAAELAAQASSGIAERTAKMIERCDEDGDGPLSQEEMPQPRRGGSNGLTQTAAAVSRKRSSRKAASTPACAASTSAAPAARKVKRSSTDR